MNYFQVTSSTDPKVTGSNSGFQVFIENTGDIQAYESLNDQFCEQKLSKEINFQIFHPNPRIKLTDYLSVGSNLCRGLLVNNKFLKILLNLSLPEIEIHEIFIQKNQEAKPYYWIRVLDQYYPYLDFEKTKLMARNTFSFGEYAPTDIKSEADFKSFIQNNGPLFRFRPSEKYYFNKPYESKDLIIINYIDNNYYFSEHLVNKMKENSITGLDFFPTNFL